MSATCFGLVVMMVGAVIAGSSANAECKDWYLYCQSLCGSRANKWCAAGSADSCFVRYGECKRTNVWRDSYGNLIPPRGKRQHHLHQNSQISGGRQG